MIELGEVVQIDRAPMGCCGVLKVGWFGTVASRIEMSNTETGEDSCILILEDNTLVWEHECSVHETKNGMYSNA